MDSTVRVHYPFDRGELTLRGSGAALSWDAGAPLDRLEGGVWTRHLRGLEGPIELKPLLADRHWARGPNWTLHPGQTLDVFPRFFRARGSWSIQWPDFRSAVLQNRRGVWIYWPPTMLENPLVRAPVAYFCDGQNLFDPASSYAGVTWRVAETMDAAAEDGSIAEALVVGVENAGVARADEYTPAFDEGYGAGGRADASLDMLVAELKPLVDSAFRTLTGPEHTALVGSSLGGLFAAYAGATRPHVFGLVGAMSPATWWANGVLFDVVRATPRELERRARRVYVDAGSVGDDLDGARALADTYREAGYADGSSLCFVAQEGGEHSERFWAERLPGALRFLLGPARGRERRAQSAER